MAYDDDLTDSVTLSLDRANAPQGGMVHITISDTRLNLDPTGSDVWLLDTNHADDANATDDDVDTVGVVNARYVMANGDTPTVDLGDDHGSLTTPFTIAEESTIITVEETGRNTDAFVSFTANVSPIEIADDADINSRLTASYAGADATVTVRDESVDISITSDDFWNSGEAATVTVDAPNLDKNTKVDDDISITSSPIPTIVIGSPITIAGFTAHDYGWLADDR